MIVALIGGNGNIGCPILAEITRPRHTAAIIVQAPKRVAAESKVGARKDDVPDPVSLVDLKICDALISTVHVNDSHPR